MSPPKAWQPLGNCTLWDWGVFFLNSVSSLAIRIPEGHGQVLPLELSPQVSKALEALWVQK